jgi:predicted nucleic acid-binding protein
LAFISVDTSVFVRLEGKYKATLDCFLETSDVVAISNEVLKEYAGRAQSSKLILQAFIQGLMKKGKLEFFSRSFITSAVRRYRNARRINYPTHNRDKKLVELAVAVKAQYIISTDRHLLALTPNRRNGDIIECIGPLEYTQTRCPDED